MTPRRILLFTGNGKGKSTAAFGMLARALGHGMKARVIQFVKSDDAVGEQRFFSQLEGVEWEQFGKGFLPRDRQSPKMQEHRAAARAGLDAAIAALPLLIMMLCCLMNSVLRLARILSPLNRCLRRFARLRMARLW